MALGKVDKDATTEVAKAKEATVAEKAAEEVSKTKVNPIAKEAVAPKAEANPSKIAESKKAVEERKEEDAARKPSHSDLMASLKKQTKAKIASQGISSQRQLKPKSFPDPTFNSK